jgi:hypothetical protein
LPWLGVLSALDLGGSDWPWELEVELFGSDAAFVFSPVCVVGLLSPVLWSGLCSAGLFSLARLRSPDSVVFLSWPLLSAARFSADPDSWGLISLAFR